MNSIVFALASAYVVMSVLLLSMGLSSRWAWWIKATAIVVASVYFVVVFFQTRDLLGWPGNGKLPPKFQLLWVRVVEPEPRTGNPGAVYLWAEALDQDNIPSGIPRAYTLPYTRMMADKSAKARDEIMQGNPMSGTAEDMDDNGDKKEEKKDQKDDGKQKDLNGAQRDNNAAKIDIDALNGDAQKVEFQPAPVPLLPQKMPN